jgi:FKBP-type peptidyl-prolyl cis-trans isomerase
MAKTKEEEAAEKAAEIEAKKEADEKAAKIAAEKLAEEVAEIAAKKEADEKAKLGKKKFEVAVTGFLALGKMFRSDTKIEWNTYKEYIPAWLKDGKIRIKK